MIYEWTLAVASVYFLCIKGDGHMMIVRIKGTASVDTQNLVRERIKQQISEGLVVHDDFLEITFADDMCTECGNTDLEEITVRIDEQIVVDHEIKCNACGHSRKGDV